jgi:hypothetical protein
MERLRFLPRQPGRYFADRPRRNRRKNLRPLPQILLCPAATCLKRFSCRNRLEITQMTQDQARTAYKMALMAFNQYRREIAAGESHGVYLRDWRDALSAMASDLSERFPDLAEDGYFRVPRI